MMTHNIHDTLMLQEFFEMKLTMRDSLVWFPEQPSHEFGYYKQDYYIYSVDMAKQGHLVLHLKNDVKYKTKALKLDAREEKRTKKVHPKCCTIQ